VYELCIQYLRKKHLVVGITALITLLGGQKNVASEGNTYRVTYGPAIELGFGANYKIYRNDRDNEDDNGTHGLTLARGGLATRFGAFGVGWQRSLYILGEINVGNAGINFRSGVAAGTTYCQDFICLWAFEAGITWAFDSVFPTTFVSAGIPIAVVFQVELQYDWSAHRLGTLLKFAIPF